MDLPEIDFAAVWHMVGEESADTWFSGPSDANHSD